jgi:hypothetical protein
MGNTPNIEIPDTVGAVALISHNRIRNGSRYGEDGYIYDIETGERVGKYFLGGRATRDTRIWAGYTEEHLPDLEHRMFEIRRRAMEYQAFSFSEIVRLCERSGPKPCTTPHENGCFRRFFLGQHGPHKTFGSSWFTTGETDGFYDHGCATRTRDGDRIAHLEARANEWWRRSRLFSGEIDSMFVKLCLDRFGTDCLEHTTRIDVNGRIYYYELYHTERFSCWRKLIWPADGLNEISLDEWDCGRDQESICRCGHSYRRHFDSYEGMSNVGCKYCFCRRFEMDPAPEDHAERVVGAICGECRALLRKDSVTCAKCRGKVEPWDPVEATT